MRKLTMIVIVAMAMTFAACGNQGSSADGGDKGKSQANGKVTYETFTVEKYGASFELPKGMRRTDDPKMDNGGAWTFVPESEMFAINAAVDFGVTQPSSINRLKNGRYN